MSDKIGRFTKMNNQGIRPAKDGLPWDIEVSNDPIKPSPDYGQTIGVKVSDTNIVKPSPSYTSPNPSNPSINCPITKKREYIPQSFY